MEAYAYDGAGRKAAQLDAEGYLTEYTYDAAGHLSSSSRYASRVPGGSKIRSEAFDAGVPADFVANPNGAPSPDWVRASGGRIEITSGPAATQGWPYLATSARNYDLGGGRTVTYRSEVTLENVYSNAIVRGHGFSNGITTVDVRDAKFRSGPIALQSAGESQYVAPLSLARRAPISSRLSVARS